MLDPETTASRLDRLYVCVFHGKTVAERAMYALEGGVSPATASANVA